MSAALRALRRVLPVGRVVAAGTVLLVLGPVVAFGVHAFVAGWQLQHVRSGSMEPLLPVGSLAVLEPVDPAEVAVGQVITFTDPADGDRLVTHRVVEVREDQDGLRFTTQGDANTGADPLPVRADDLRGHLASHVPHLGVAIDAIQSPAAPFVLIGLPALGLAGSEVVAWRRRRRWAGACARCHRPAGPIALDPLT